MLFSTYFGYPWWTGIFNLGLLINQIFCLMCDWSKQVMWPNIPQLKLGNIREYSSIFLGNVCFSEQIMSADKYPRHIFRPIGGYCLFTSFKSFITGWCNSRVFSCSVIIYSIWATYYYTWQTYAHNVNWEHFDFMNFRFFYLGFFNNNLLLLF